MDTRNNKKRSAEGDLTLTKLIDKKRKLLGDSELIKNNNNNNNIIPSLRSRNKDLIHDFNEDDLEESEEENDNNDDMDNLRDVSSKLGRSSYIKAVMQNSTSRTRSKSSQKSNFITNFTKTNFNSNITNPTLNTKTQSKSKSRSKIKVIPEENEVSPKDLKTIEFLPCREKEQEAIYTYIKKGLQTSGSYTGLYISGMPGTGKTACVTQIINKLKIEAKRKEVNVFKVLELNGMKITNPNSVFKQIYDSIFSDGRSTSMKKCVSLLDNFFKNRKDFDCKTQLRDISNSHIILIIDEIDCLINKKQLLLYNIFNWTTYTQSKLLIISISNTLDLPEKLMPKISSRMGNNRLSFKPYQKDELVKILSVKIDSFDLFSDDAVKLSAMKVAAVNGDLRRILQICRRAKEIFDSTPHDKKARIDKFHILKATEDLFDSKVQKVIGSLQAYEKITLAAILFQIKIQTNNKVSVEKVYERFRYFYAKFYTVPCLITFEEYMLMIYNLAKMQIVAFTETYSSNFVNNSLIIKFYADEFMVVVSKDEKFADILTDLA